MEKLSNYAKIERISPKVCKVKFSSTMPTRSEFEVYLNDLYCTIYRNIGHLYLVMDSSQAAFISDDLCKVQAEWIQKNHQLLSKKIKMTIFVIPSAAQRLIFHKVTKLQKMATPFQLVNTFESAINMTRTEEFERPLYLDETTLSSN